MRDCTDTETVSHKIFYVLNFKNPASRRNSCFDSSVENATFKYFISLVGPSCTSRKVNTSFPVLRSFSGAFKELESNSTTCMALLFLFLKNLMVRLLGILWSSHTCMVSHPLSTELLCVQSDFMLSTSTDAESFLFATASMKSQHSSLVSKEYRGC
jgi:hypothetical protein